MFPKNMSASFNFSESNVTETTPRQIRNTDYVYVTCLLSVVGFFMNLFSLLILLCHKTMRSNKYYRAVILLSFGDALASGCAFMWVLARFVFKTLSPDIDCKIISVLMLAAFIQTHLQVILFATERCLLSSISKIGHSLCVSKVQIVYMILSWIFSVAYVVTLVVKVKEKSKSTFCSGGTFEMFQGPNIDIGFGVALATLILQVLLFVLYSITLKNIIASSKRIGAARNNAPDTCHAKKGRTRQVEDEIEQETNQKRCTGLPKDTQAEAIIPEREHRQRGSEDEGGSEGGSEDVEGARQAREQDKFTLFVSHSPVSVPPKSTIITNLGEKPIPITQLPSSHYSISTVRASTSKSCDSSSRQFPVTLHSPALTSWSNRSLKEKLNKDSQHATRTTLYSLSQGEHSKHMPRSDVKVQRNQISAPVTVIDNVAMKPEDIVQIFPNTNLYEEKLKTKSKKVVKIGQVIDLHADKLDVELQDMTQAMERSDSSGRIPSLTAYNENRLSVVELSKDKSEYRMQGAGKSPSTEESPAENREIDRKVRRKMKIFPWVFRTFITSCAILLVVIVSYLPIEVLFIHEKIHDINVFPGRGFVITLPILSSIVNPIIYVWRIREFRRVIKQTFRIK